MSQGRITALYIYPIKSCAGIALEEAWCDAFGLLYDREWVIADCNGKVLTQRDNARMALIKPQLDPDGRLTLQAPHKAPLLLGAISETAKHVDVDMWGDACGSCDQGADAARWLNDFLGIPCRLLRNVAAPARRFRRIDSNDRKIRASFADCCPLSLMSEESLQHLNECLADPVPMNRFRPSIVISGAGKYAEDRLKSFAAGESVLRSIKPCVRCVIETIDQDEGVITGPEPLRTLSKYRRQGGKILFGQYFAADKPGVLRVGDVVSECVNHI